jgi:hypothetical protein
MSFMNIRIDLARRADARAAAPGLLRDVLRTARL